MTSIQNCRRSYKKRIFKGLSGFLPSLKYTYNKFFVDPFVVDLVVILLRSFIIKYINKNLQKILKIVLKAQLFSINRPCKKLLKTEISDVYCDKSHIE